MAVPQLIVFVFGVIFLCAGLVLMVYGALPKTRAYKVQALGGAAGKGNWLAQILEALPPVLKELHGYLPNKESRIGLLLVIFGFVLILLSGYVIDLRTLMAGFSAS